MPSLAERYRIAATTPSDINEHVPYLSRLAEDVEHITEFGTRTGVSTIAFLAGHPDVLHTYDIERKPEVDGLLAIAERHNIAMTFHLEDVCTATIEETDLLFIDTWHTEVQLRTELALHHTKVRRYIVLHDTETYREEGESPGHRGLRYALESFLQNHSEWRVKDHRTYNNGLTVLERIGSNHAS